MQRSPQPFQSLWLVCSQREDEHRTAGTAISAVAGEKLPVYRSLGTPKRIACASPTIRIEPRWFDGRSEAVCYSESIWSAESPGG
jgi:hypothetical protein